MFDTILPVVAEIIEPDAVFLFIHDPFQRVLEFCELDRVDETFEDGILYTLTEIFAFLCNLPEPSPALPAFLCSHHT